MWKWLKSVFSFGSPTQDDPMFWIKKIVRTSVGVVLMNNPQFTVPVAAGLAGVELLLKTKQPADVIKAEIDRQLKALAQNATTNPILRAEIMDLSTMIQVKVAPLPEAEKLVMLQQIIDAIQVGIDYSKVK